MHLLLKVTEERRKKDWHLTELTPKSHAEGSESGALNILLPSPSSGLLTPAFKL